MRWCTISAEEQSKCEDFKEVLKKIDNTSVPECVQAENAVTCMDKINKEEADLITLDGGDIYKAGKAQKLSNRSDRIIFAVYFKTVLTVRGNMEKGKRPRKFWDALGAWIIKLVSRCLLI